MVDMSTLDPCLEGISFPADVHTIVECAEGNLCPREVISEVAQVSDRTFSSKDELLCSLGNPEYCSTS
ncbi:MAG: DUF2795 domain-containing protein [Actinobacteria bacterium]|nr:DUF2795 domain-containing protein [Actinomycetota bacterium]